MNYNNIDCPVCGIKFNENDDVVVCPVCGTPHHRECWHKNGRCINEEKHIEGFIWQMTNTAPAPVKNQDSNTKICPRCGEKNPVYEPVCIRCGERLKKTESPFTAPQMPPMNENPADNWQTEANPNAFSPYQNVYAQDAKTVFGDDAMIDDIPASEVAEYIQKDSNKYIGRMLGMQEKNTKLSWSWASALGSFFWCFYRKMTGLGTILILIYLLVSFCASLIIPTIASITNPEMYNEYLTLAKALTDLMTHLIDSGATNFPPEYYELWGQLMSSPLMIASSIVNGATMLIICVTTGFFGTHFYKKKVLKDIRTIRRVSVNSVSYHMYLRQRGNVSVINLLLPVMIYMLYTMVTSYL